MKIKKAKGRKCAIKQPLEFQDFKNFLAANQFKKEINYPHKNKIDTNSLRKQSLRIHKKQKINIEIPSKN